MDSSPTLSNIERIRSQLGELVVETPVHHWRGPELQAAIGSDIDVFLKLELFQYTGTFKPRGALSVMLNLPRERIDRGVTAVSAGNHAIAVAYAARCVGVSAKVVMLNS